MASLRRRTKTRPSLLWITSLLLAACQSPRASAPGAADVLRSLAKRPFEGRLFEMPFRPFARETAAARPATEEPQGRLSPLPAPEAWQGQLGGNGHRSGPLADLDLARGRVEVAISHFEGALEIDPASAALHNDAAVAYLERGRRTGSAFDFLAALRHSLRATELAPDSPAARFNLALSFEAFFLRHLAQRAWNRWRRLQSSVAILGLAGR
jgi:tetratricopeptide (TPR) repeat protein